MHFAAVFPRIYTFVYKSNAFKQMYVYEFTHLYTCVVKWMDGQM